MKRAKFYLFVCFSFLLTGCSKDQIIKNETGTFTDSRDNHVYKSVKIGAQIWMAENLAFLPAVSPSSIGSDSSALYYVYNYEGSSISEAKTNSNCTSYGILYNWKAATIACPSGWHLPPDAEWTILEDYLGALPGKKMKSITGWSESGNGDNSSGFNALPGGGRIGYQGFNYLGYYAGFWSASGGATSIASYRSLHSGGDDVGRGTYERSFGFSVRCIRN